MSAIGNLFRLTWYRTESENKYDAETRCEYIGDRDSIWSLWATLTKQLDYKHVEVFSLDGTRQEPELGRYGLTGYNV